MTFTRTSLPSISYYFSRRSKKDLPFFPASCVQGSNNQRSWNPFQAVWPGWVLVSVSSILPQHGVKSSNFSWAVWSKIIYRFLLLRYCILSSWKSLILIIYQNKRNPKQILNISRHGLDWLGGGTIIGTAGCLGDCLSCVVRWRARAGDVLSWTQHVSLCGLRTPQTRIYDLDNCHNQTQTFTSYL